MSVKAELWRKQIEAHLRRELNPVVHSAGTLVQTEMKTMLNRSGSPSSPGSPPGKDTGTLGRSIQIDASGADRLSVHVGTKLPYAAIQEFGGTIKPKNVRRLPVPLNREAKFMQRRGSLRGQDLTFIPRRGKDPLLVRKTKGGGFKPMFVLKRSVTLPPRPFVAPTRKRVVNKIRKLVAKGVAVAMKTLPGRP